MTRPVLIGAALVAVAAVVGGGAYWFATGDRPAPAAHVQVATASVVRTSLATTTQLSATLGYADPEPYAPQTEGTITGLPAPGTTIEQGQALYELDGASVYLFYGQRPAWRSFEAGMPPGADILQLEQNLQALGFGTGLTVDTVFTWGTAQAIESWQRATGQPVTGSIELGRVQFAQGPRRIASVAESLGAQAGPGQPILTATSPDPVITVQTPPEQAYLVHVGDAVTVTMPSGATARGTVTGVSAVAQTQAGDTGSQQGSPSQVIVPATVALTDPASAAGFDQAPVTVNVTDRKVDHVLAVPITALVALAGGGYGVWIVPGQGGRRLTSVTPGLFANTLVQITGRGIAAGDKVEVPAP